jgi:conjugal transfer pilus assembly protein TraW
MRRTAALLLLAAAAVAAKDLGVQGRVWPIEEVDMRQLVAESAAKVDWNAVDKERRDSVNEALSSLPGRRLPVANETTVAWIDPSITLASDIHAPVRNAAGLLEWRAIYRKGERINPLAHVRPVTAMLFFDGSSQEQVAYVKAVLARQPLTVVPIDVAGRHPGRLAEDVGRPVYFASEEMLARFSVTHAPSLLFPGSGAQGLRLGLVSFARPFRVEELERWWPGPTQKNLTGSLLDAKKAR